MSTQELVPLSSVDIQLGENAERARFAPLMRIDFALERRAIVRQAFTDLMREGEDYGKIPGTGSKPTLLQPGAQKLDNLFGLVPRFPMDLMRVEEDWTGERHGGEPFFRYMITCQLMRNEFVMGECIGECNSWEVKYRYRTSQRKCPTCGIPALIEGKQFKPTDPKQWICFAKKGGCGAKFPITEPSIVEQTIGRTPNPEIFDQINTLLKMAQKRAHVGATINATSASEYFTQDYGDPEPMPPPPPEFAEGIDTGGNPVGTKEAAAHVAQRKIEELREANHKPLQSTPPDAPLSPQAATVKAVPAAAREFDMLDAFRAMKDDLRRITGSDHLYRSILESKGYKKSNEIKTREEGKEIWKMMEKSFKQAMDVITVPMEQKEGSNG